MSLDAWIAKLESMTPAEKLATVTLDDVRFYDDVMVLEWSGVIGFGEYRINLTRESHEEEGCEVTDSYALEGRSECMDVHNDKKVFLRHLLEQFIDKVDLSEEKAREADWEARQKEKQLREQSGE